MDNNKNKIIVFILILIIFLASVFLNEEKEYENFYVKKILNENSVIKLNDNLKIATIELEGKIYNSNIIKKIDEENYQINVEDLNRSFFINIEKSEKIQVEKK